jgi:hypothetical protein
MSNTPNERRPEPLPIDDIEDRMGSVHPLDFDRDEARDDDRAIGDALPDGEQEQRFSPERVREAGLTAASVEDHQPTADDLSPETLIDESGARSAREYGENIAADTDLSEVDAEDIGAGHGLDEAELARLLPLDGKPEEDLLPEDESILDDAELSGDALLDSGRDRTTEPPTED